MRSTATAAHKAGQLRFFGQHMASARNVQADNRTLKENFRAWVLRYVTKARPTGSNSKNPTCEAVRREAEEDWRRERWR